MSFHPLLHDLINKVCQPSPEAIPDELQRNIAFSRNKAIFPIAVLMIPGYILLMIFEPRISFQLHLCTLFLLVCQISLWFYFCRTRIEVFHWLYFLTTTFYLPFFVSQYCKELVFGAYSGIFVIPLTLLPVKKMYLLSTISQIIFLNTTYKSVMEELTAGYGDNLVASHLVTAGNFASLISLFSLYGIDETLSKAHKGIAEAKEAKFKQQKAFILSFSHELRNPINSILGNVQLALIEPSLKETKNLVYNISVCGQLLAQLVNNILDSAKVEIGRLEVDPAPTNVKILIENIWEVCSDLIRKKKLHGLLRIGKNLSSILNVDSIRLTQMMMNLVSNAVKFTQNGTVSVQIQWIKKEETTLQTEDPEPFDEDGLFDKEGNVSLLTRKKGQTKEYYLLDLQRRSLDGEEDQLFRHTSQEGILKISVSDTGCGMSPEAVGKLFQMFGQVSEDVSKRNVGTGLGLFITKELCERMNGEIKVYSKPGEGTVFVMDIPIKCGNLFSLLTDILKAFLSQLLEKDLKQRLGSKGAEEIKSHAFFEGLDWDAVLNKKLLPSN